ncbi:MAG: hypothetical protein ACTSQY_06130 [Candidatus Odinarchaeia archaeon]
MPIFKKYVYTLHEKDAAPMLPLIDITPILDPSDCCIPVPMRVDKVINGDLTTFIQPNQIVHCSIEGVEYCLSFRNQISEIISLIAKWSKMIVKHRFKKTLPVERLNHWLEKTVSTQISVPTLSEDLTDFIYFFFEKVLVEYINNGDVRNSLLDYADYIIEVCKLRLEDNMICVIEKGNEVEHLILKKPLTEDKLLDHSIVGETIPVDIEINQQRKTLRFRPFLIYQDLLETFKFNKQKILEGAPIISIKTLFDKNIIFMMDEKKKQDTEELLDIKSLKEVFNFKS